MGGRATHASRLTEAELSAVITAAGAADPDGTFDHLPEAERAAADRALESGLEKLRAQLARHREKKERR